MDDTKIFLYIIIGIVLLFAARVVFHLTARFFVILLIIAVVIYFSLDNWNFHFLNVFGL